MPKKKPTGTRQAQRARSEQALLDAFEALFKRHGVHGVGVNAVLDNAGVGKRLLYEYFGDLEGLASAWAKGREDPLALGERRDTLEEQVATLTPARRMSALMGDYATELRKHPWATQVLLTELQESNNLARAMREIRQQMGDGYEGMVLDAAPKPVERKMMALAFVLHAATTYLALRARFAPDYNGLDLRGPAGWEAAMSMLDTVAEAMEAPDDG